MFGWRHLPCYLLSTPGNHLAIRSLYLLRREKQNSEDKKLLKHPELIIDTSGLIIEYFKLESNSMSRYPKSNAFSHKQTIDIKNSRKARWTRLELTFRSTPIYNLINWISENNWKRFSIHCKKHFNEMKSCKPSMSFVYARSDDSPSQSKTIVSSSVHAGLAACVVKVIKWKHLFGVQWISWLTHEKPMHPIASPNMSPKIEGYEFPDGK